MTIDAVEFRVDQPFRNRSNSGTSRNTYEYLRRALGISCLRPLSMQARKGNTCHPWLIGCSKRSRRGNAIAPSACGESPKDEVGPKAHQGPEHIDAKICSKAGIPARVSPAPRRVMHTAVDPWETWRAENVRWKRVAAYSIFSQQCGRYPILGNCFFWTWCLRWLERP